MTGKRFTVEKMDLVSDHLSTRFYIKDNLDEEYYDVRHMVSEGFEVQYDTWATNIANKMNELSDENEELKNRVDELEDDNMKYTLSTDKLEGYTKRFIPTKCINEFRDCKTNRYYLLDNEDNFTGALELLNLLDCKNEKLKSENRQLKGMLSEYKEQIKER